MNTLSMAQLREWAHDAIAPLGVIAFIYGGLTDALASQNVIHVSMTVSSWIGLVGIVIANVSKVTDSLNNAYVSGKAAAPTVELPQPAITTSSSNPTAIRTGTLQPTTTAPGAIVQILPQLGQEVTPEPQPPPIT